MEVELTENRLRACRAERMVLENERVSRLRSLLTSPRPEPDKVTFDLSPDERKRVCLLVYLCFVLYLWLFYRLLWQLGVGQEASVCRVPSIFH